VKIGSTVKIAFVRPSSREGLDNGKNRVRCDLRRQRDSHRGQIRTPAARLHRPPSTSRAGSGQDRSASSPAASAPPASRADADLRRQRAAARRTLQTTSTWKPLRASKTRWLEIRRLREWSSPTTAGSSTASPPTSSRQKAIPSGRSTTATNQEYEADRRSRLGEEGAKPKRIRYKGRLKKAARKYPV